MQINQALDNSFQYRSLPPWTADKETPTHLCVSGTEKINSEVFVFHFLSLYNYISNTQRWLKRRRLVEHVDSALSSGTIILSFCVFKIYQTTHRKLLDGKPF